eukprot:TRINITY_DN37858_c0_g1_i1.p1 TRINITY_DN37858_c0_g1~~TRINITY_DN37858_c0_g1_i1.p1  ORF type:complete len:415 (+),score=43.46 TRINITY_DN37858_c0_g1_i1:91-1335(+)
MAKSGFVLYILGWCVCLAAIGVAMRGGDETLYWRLSAGMLFLFNLVFTVAIPSPMGSAVVPVPFPDAVVMVGIDVLLFLFPLLALYLDISITTAYWWALPLIFSFITRSHMLTTSSNLLRSQVNSYEKSGYLTPRETTQKPLLRKVPILNVASTVISNVFLWKNVKHQKITDHIVVDIWTPPSGCEGKVMLFLHGGAWIGGSHRWQSPAVFLHKACQSGYTVVSCGYRKGKWPTQVIDAADTLLWITNTLKPKKLLISGASAGGHIASLLTGIVTGGRPPGLEKVSDMLSEKKIKVDGYIGWYPAFSPGSNLIMSLYFKNIVCRRDPVNWEAIDPSRILSKSFPPSLVFHGTSDSVVPIRQSELFFARLMHTRKHSEDMFLRLPYLRHTFEILAADITNTATDVSVGWMDEVCR